MAGLDVVRFGVERYRLGSWRGMSGIGYLAPLTPPEHLSVAGLDRARERLARRGFREVFTSALSDLEQRPFREAGFIVHERLHLLRHDLVDPPEPPVRHRVRRPLPWERAAVLGVDHLAFEPFWRLDRASLAEAIDATPRARFRVVARVGVARSVNGYAVTGLAARHGYLQRLAVHPDRYGEGIGTTLTLDALGWARARGAQGVSVNTQEGNERALRLYRNLGFVPVEPGLAVLRCELAPTP